MRDFRPKIDNTAPALTGVLAAAEDDVRFLELKTAVSSAGIALDPPDGPDTLQNKLSQAMARYASGGVMCQDNGVANAAVLAITGTFVAPRAYFKGMRVKFYAAASYTGPATINAFGLGTRKFLTHTSNPMAGAEVVGGREIEADFEPALDGGTGAFRITPWANALLFPSGTATVTQVTTGEGVAVQTVSPYHVDLNYPALTSVMTTPPAATDLFTLYQQSATRHKSITWNALLAAIQQYALPIATATVLGGVKQGAGLAVAGDGTLSTRALNLYDLVIADQKTPGSNGGDFSAVNTWNGRDLNTVEFDSGRISYTLSANQITLPVGTYEVSFRAPVIGVGSVKTRLQDTTGVVTLMTGGNVNVAQYTTNNADGVGHGVFTLTAAHQIRIEQSTSHPTVNAGTGMGANGLGSGGYNTGLPEVFSRILIRKIT